MRVFTRCVVTAILLHISIVVVDRSMAQGKNPSASPSAPSSSSNGPSSSSPSPSGPSGSNSTLQGKSFPKNTWDTQLRQLPKAGDFGFLSDKGMVFVCYKLAVAGNAATPFVLNNVPIDATDDPPQWKRNHHYSASDWVYSSKHNGRYYQALGSGDSGDTEPDFPSAAGSTVTEAKGSHLVWRDGGYFGYSPFVPRWTPNTNYPAGAIVTLSTVKGHYFESQLQGLSGSSEPKQESGKATEQSGLIWKDMGDMLSSDRRECANVTSSRPLLMNQNLVIAIEMTDIPEEIQDRFTILNFNVTSQQVQPINVTPIQPSIAAGTASGAEGGVGAAVAHNQSPKRRKIYYLTWPSLVVGDSIMAISVNVVYTPIAPALPWKPHTFYPQGSIVISSATTRGSSTTNGHYYLALNNGISSDGANPPAFNSAVGTVQTFAEGSGLTWKDMGPTPPLTAPPVWTQDTLYGTGDLIIPPGKTGHYYRAQAHARSGAHPPPFSAGMNGGTVPELPSLSWRDMGSVLPVPTPSMWTPGQMYYTDDPIIPPTANGHYYRALVSGNSRSTPPAFPVSGISVDDGPNLSWTDLGSTTLNPSPPLWQANSAYAAGAQVTPNPPNGHFYQATARGVTGPNAPAFPVDGTTVPETNGLVWSDSGATLPTNGKLKYWAATTPFMVNDVIQDSLTGHYYTAIQAGISGLIPPTFSIPAPKTVSEHEDQITWQDLGTSLPSSISTGQPQPTDQTVSAISYSFPQSHGLSYFLLASGVVVSSITTTSFQNTSSSSTPNWTTVKDGPIVDPILSLTAFLKPVDAERPWHRSDLIPGATVAFSLTSPSTNFYLGGTTVAFRRNIQALYGLSLARVSVLEAPSSQLSATSPATRQQFAKGGFVGVSFNILGLITSVF